MKTDAISKAMANAADKGMATQALSNLPDGGAPTDLPATPDTTPPVATGSAPAIDEATGLPLIQAQNVPSSFPADQADGGDADEILDFLFS